MCRFLKTHTKATCNDSYIVLIALTYLCHTLKYVCTVSVRRRVD